MLNEGDVLICTYSFSPAFTEGKEYTVYLSGGFYTITDDLNGPRQMSTSTFRKKATFAQKRAEILDEAKRLIGGDRAQQYGDAKEMHTKIASLWSEYLGPNLLVDRLEAHQIAMMMVLLKVARSTTTPKDDTFIDIAGYAALGAEMA